MTLLEVLQTIQQEPKKAIIQLNNGAEIKIKGKTIKKVFQQLSRKELHKRVQYFERVSSNLFYDKYEIFI